LTTTETDARSSTLDPEPILIEVKNLKTYFQLDEGTVKAVDGATFDIRRGQTLGIVGESGSGKSIMARSILRIVGRPGRIVEGQILYHRRRPGVAGEEVVDLARLDPYGGEIRRIRGAEIAMIFQEPMTSFSPIHTVGNQIVEGILLHQPVDKRQAREIAIEALRRVGMSRPEQRIDQYPYELSGGMRQRAMIAMAMACNPQLLIADEPTTALDVTTQAQILSLMQALKQDTGAGILMITHDLGVIAEVAQSVVVMYLGRVVEVADVRSLFRDPKHPYTQALLRSIPRLGRRSRERLEPVKGMVPSPYNRPRGCPFHPRCPAFMPGKCDRVIPTPVPVGPGRQVSCLLYSGGEEIDGR
jgi:oligopeptide/dipeptide ABC transporter ATP-binding protein